MRIWAKLGMPVLVLCMLLTLAGTIPSTAMRPVVAQAAAKASAAPVTTVKAGKVPAPTVPARGSGSEIFIRADLQPDGQYKFVGGLTRDLAGQGLRLSVTTLSVSHFLSPSEWRWVDQTYDDMQPVDGYTSVHVTKPLYMRADQSLDVNLMSIDDEADGHVSLPDARMKVMACRPGTCPKHLQIDLQVYYGTSGVQETLTTQIAAPHNEKLRNGFITYPDGPSNNQPQRPYGSNRPTRQVSQIVVPYELGLRGVDAYSAVDTTATREYFIPGDALADATTNIYAGV